MQLIFNTLIFFKLYVKNEKLYTTQVSLYYKQKTALLIITLTVTFVNFPTAFTKRTN